MKWVTRLYTLPFLSHVVVAASPPRVAVACGGGEEGDGWVTIDNIRRCLQPLPGAQVCEQCREYALKVKKEGGVIVPPPELIFAALNNGRKKDGTPRVRSFGLEDCARFGELCHIALSQTPVHLRRRLRMKRTANPFEENKTSDVLRMLSGEVASDRTSTAKDYGPYIVVNRTMQNYDALLGAGWTERPYGSGRNTYMQPPCFMDIWPPRIPRPFNLDDVDSEAYLYLEGSDDERSY